MYLKRGGYINWVLIGMGIMGTNFNIKQNLSQRYDYYQRFTRCVNHGVCTGDIC